MHIESSDRDAIDGSVRAVELVVLRDDLHASVVQSIDVISRGFEV